jgi:hypothetical protein
MKYFILSFFIVVLASCAHRSPIKVGKSYQIQRSEAREWETIEVEEVKGNWIRGKKSFEWINLDKVYTILDPEHTPDNLKPMLFPHEAEQDH